MEHLERHPHALVKNGVIVWIGEFEQHDDSVMESLKTMMNADKIECLCNLGYLVGQGWHWDSVNQIYYQLPDEEMDPTIYYGWSPEFYGEQGYHEYVLNRVVE